MEDENFQKINIFELWSLHCLFMNVNSLWLAKNIEKYYSWFWSSLMKILDLLSQYCLAKKPFWNMGIIICKRVA